MQTESLTQSSRVGHGSNIVRFLSPSHWLCCRPLLQNEAVEFAARDSFTPAYRIALCSRLAFGERNTYASSFNTVPSLRGLDLRFS